MSQLPVWRSGQTIWPRREIASGVFDSHSAPYPACAAPVAVSRLGAVTRTA